MGFLAFSVSLIIGLIVNNPFVTVVGRSLLMLFLFYVLGCVLSALGHLVVKEHFDRQVQALEAQPAATQNPETAEEENRAPASKATAVG